MNEWVPAVDGRKNTRDERCDQRSGLEDEVSLSDILTSSSNGRSGSDPTTNFDSSETLRSHDRRFFDHHHTVGTFRDWCSRHDSHCATSFHHELGVRASSNLAENFEHDRRFR
jgi:hypothetical protein